MSVIHIMELVAASGPCWLWSSWQLLSSPFYSTPLALHFWTRFRLFLVRSSNSPINGKFFLHLNFVGGIVHVQHIELWRGLSPAGTAAAERPRLRGEKAILSMVAGASLVIFDDVHPYCSLTLRIKLIRSLHFLQISISNMSAAAYGWVSSAPVM